MTAEKIKGPWRRVGHRQIMDAEGAVVCEVWSSVGIQEANANEDLIAAAPDLLVESQGVAFLLRLLFDEMDIFPEETFLNIKIGTQTVRVCVADVQSRFDAVIAKATGAAA